MSGDKEAQRVLRRLREEEAARQLELLDARKMQHETSRIIGAKIIKVKDSWLKTMIVAGSPGARRITNTTKRKSGFDKWNDVEEAGWIYASHTESDEMGSIHYWSAICVSGKMLEDGRETDPQEWNYGTNQIEGAEYIDNFSNLLVNLAVDNGVNWEYHERNSGNGSAIEMDDTSLQTIKSMGVRALSKIFKQ